MLFEDILNDCKTQINEYIVNGKKISNKNILIICKKVYDLNIKKNPTITFEKIYILMNQLFKIKYKAINCDVDSKCIRDCDYMFKEVKIPEEYKELQKQFNKLRDLPQPEQRTQEWFDYRHNRITASDTASAIDLNPYEPVESFILKKCDPDHKFLDNQNVYHGKKYEPIATSIYEYIYNNKVIEFGALPSDKYEILGASPDGICSSQSLDYKFSPLLGRMLEIKCTVQRKIYTSGKIAGTICPFYYYCQVQQQLECCNLDKCDFWQCKLTEYKNKTEYLIDECLDTIHTVGVSKKNDTTYSDSEQIQIDNRIKKGIILKFLPKIWTPEFDGDSIEWKSKFIYPTNLLMDETEYNEWIVSILSDWQMNYPSIAETHYYEKIVYWKLEMSHNITINRDIKFFQNILPILNDTWLRVLYYRNNMSKLNELREIIKKRTKFIKFDTKININNNLVNKKILFLNYPNTAKELKIKSFNEDNEFLD
jgi:putative phage-type endonuclease